MATIITKNSSTASSVPLASQLVQGELAVNVTDKRLFTEDSGGSVVELGTNPSSLTLPNGVANGVCYLNGSKVLTTGSALTFDGSTFGVAVSGSTDALRITQTGTGNALVVEDSSNPDSSPIVIDASGKLILNHGSAQPTGVNYNFQNVGKSASEGIGLGMFTNDTGAMNIRFAKSRSTTVGSFSAVQVGDELGVIAFYGDDGTDLNNRGASIFSYVDGTVATNSIPSCLVFSTTAVGGTSAAERLRIDSSGNVGIGTSSPLDKIDVVTDAGVYGGSRGSNTNKSWRPRVPSYAGTSNFFSPFFATSESTNNYMRIGGGTSTAYAATKIEFYTAADSTTTTGSLRATIDPSGNLGLGVTPSAWVSRYKIFQSGNQAALAADNTYNATSIGTNWYEGSGGDTYIGTGRALRYALQGNTGAHAWFTAPSGTAGNAISFTQAMTLDSSGNLLVGTTSGGAPVNGMAFAPGSASYFTIGSDTTTARPKIYFGNPNGWVGVITTSGTSTSYATSSDYRLKENIQPMTGALDKVAALKPCTYKWKADGSDGEGFIAHELAEVVPQCVTGEKDAVDADGNPVYQGIDTSFLVATLTAAIQELKSELDTVKAELQTLKGN